VNVVNMHDAKTHLSQLVDRALAGEEIVIGRAGKPAVKLVPVEEELRPREPGGLEGKIRIAPDFDDPLPPEIRRLFEGDED
jgi:prevent-host-death family protein